MDHLWTVLFYACDVILVLVGLSFLFWPGKVRVWAAQRRWSNEGWLGSTAYIPVLRVFGVIALLISAWLTWALLTGLVPVQ